MKIWIVKIGVNSRTFFDEKSFNDWLITTTDAASNRVVEVYEATHLESKTIKEIKDNIKDSNVRESRIQAVMSEDPWYSKFENFKIELAKYENTSWLIEKLNILSTEKKIITKFLKAQKEFLLCDITDDVQWFEVVIGVTGLKEMVEYSIKKLNGYNTRVIVSRQRKDNFLKAKENVSKTL